MNGLNAIAIGIMVVSLFGFVGNVMIDFNWGATPIAGSVALAYWMTLRWIIPFPVNYWGLGALVYFLFFLASFALLSRNERPIRILLGTLRLGSAVLIVFEIGVYYFVPGFMDKWVINAVRGTSLAIFTNWDVLGFSIVTLVVSQALISMNSQPNREH
ncbi:MAG: hypothetical protein JRN54_08985 [Nitrososphaerota archaeon]|nr:hypothetical protein [Nitrososphaerota archaeon]MDG6981467.1 hypothetical protein [Nitrososphaerota archaeon]MDG6991077.1 hypothetical protein [Nitrososphaerota archaeon]WGO50988.1 MAG: hypothetical protein JRM93_02960 [Nitrososphaerota archaeon]